MPTKVWLLLHWGISSDHFRSRTVFLISIFEFNTDSLVNFHIFIDEQSNQTISTKFSVSRNIRTFLPKKTAYPMAYHANLGGPVGELFPVLNHYLLNFVLRFAFWPPKPVYEAPFHRLTRKARPFDSELWNQILLPKVVMMDFKKKALPILPTMTRADLVLTLIGFRSPGVGEYVDDLRSVLWSQNRVETQSHWMKDQKLSNGEQRTAKL